MIASNQAFIINLAPTGLVPDRAMTPAVPLEPHEIAAQVDAAAEVGITVVHLHARDADGRPTLSKDVYARIIGAVRERRPDIVVCVSCSGRFARDMSERAQVLELEGDVKPDMASLTLSSLNFPRQASVNAPDTVKELATRMLDRGIKPELEVFDSGMANYVGYLIEREIIRPPTYANILLGNVATAQAGLLDIAAVVTRLPDGVVWCLAGLGASQLPVLAVSAAAAHGVRVGLEDCVWLDPERTKLADNVDLVRRAHSIAAAVDRPVMTAAEFRAKFLRPDP